ncbi:hypothetical protein [Actinoplanes sp. DH11]|uniref:hypothetical protein n=1 Tax=Actinoplanes sp. DH11 TaxID=2857011 RepID=UPI001E475085|nr:hypothetical protein [Actinoplanes sp. DH11]
MRVQLESDRTTARKVLKLHLAGRAHIESREAARDRVRQRGRTPAADPVFVGVTNGVPPRLLYDVEVHLESE